VKSIAPLFLLASLSMTSACMVGGDPDEDAVAGDGLGDDDFTGTETSGDGVGSIAARVCANGPTTAGIDVSYYQGVIDWNRAKASGTAFAFIRLSDGARFRDPKFDSNWANAKSAGVIRGAYQFFRPSQNIEAQANLMIQAIGRYQPGDLPPVIDVEADGGLAPSAVAAKAKQWVDLVKAGTGAAPIIYTGKYFWRDEVGGSRTFSNHALWIAQYTSKCPDLPLPWSRWMASVATSISTSSTARSPTSRRSPRPAPPSPRSPTALRPCPSTGTRTRTARTRSTRSRPPGSPGSRSASRTI
jgi:hypothetical protein